MELSSDHRSALIEHLREHALRTDGPFQLSSGGTSSWYVDGRQTTFDGAGARIVGSAAAEVLAPDVTAIGGLTMGADPVAVAAAMMATDRRLRAFSIRKQAKSHGTGGRIVGPISAADRVAIVDDTTTSGASFLESSDVLAEAGIEVVQALALVDRSGGLVAELMAQRDIPFEALVTPFDLGVIGQ